MFNWRYEGESVKQGFNVYPLDDKGSFGFIFKIKKFRFAIRYSKKVKKFFFSYDYTGPDGYYYR